jgi:hypothetical protein
MVSTLKSSIREVFDDFSLSVIYYLGTFEHWGGSDLFNWRVGRPIANNASACVQKTILRLRMSDLCNTKDARSMQ